MKIIAVSPESDYADEAACIVRLLETGLERYHIRKPGWSVAKTAALLSTVPEEWLPRISIHQHHELAESFPLGLHYKDTKDAKLKASAMQVPLSRSLHSIDGLKDASAGIDYVFLSPVFPSISKVNYAPDWSFDELRTALLNERTAEIYALGGIDLETVEEALGLGFDGVVLHGTLWRSADPVEVLAQLGRVAV